MAESILDEYWETLPGGVTMQPGTGGIFEVFLDETPIYSKRETGRFPEEGEVEQALETALNVTGE